MCLDKKCHVDPSEFLSFLNFQPEPATEPPSPLVPFLQKYANGSTKKSSVSFSGDSVPAPCRSLLLCHSFPDFFCLQVLKLELKDIREQQDLLFRFLNFLKQEGAVHVLQFCLAVGKSAAPQCGFCPATDPSE